MKKENNLLQHRVINNFLITNWCEYKEISAIPDTTDYLFSTINTILSNRNAIINTWMHKNDNGVGFEQRIIYLNDNEG